MASSSRDDSLTTLLRAWRDGDGAAYSTLIDQVYDQLRVIARRRLSQVGGDASLSPTELVHEALLKAMPAPMEFANRAHFFATMSLSIRSILVDHARARAADKRGGGLLRVTLTNNDPGEESLVVDLIAIDQALTKLEQVDPRCGQVMHLTYFAGLPLGEVGEVLGISVKTVERDLRFARAWVNDALAHGR